MSLAVANRYARAFADVAIAARLDAVSIQEQLRSFEEALKDSVPLRNVLLSPAVSPARKRAVIDGLGERLGIAPQVRNFLAVISRHRRLLLLSVIRQAVQAQLDERMGIVRARVTSAHSLAGAQQAALEGALAGLTGRATTCDFAVDNELLGGAVARIGSTIYDGSLRGRLESLRHKLTD